MTLSRGEIPNSNCDQWGFLFLKIVRNWWSCDLVQTGEGIERTKPGFGWPAYKGTMSYACRS